jgi:hydrogenase expression/formation protein HypC
LCLAIPGRVEAVLEEGRETRTGRIDFGGVRRAVSLAFVPEAGPGDYVLVHAGFAISVVDESEARRVFDYLQEIGALDEELS